MPLPVAHALLVSPPSPCAGNVPALVVETSSGSKVLLNQGAATLQFIADNAPKKIIPAAGTIERYQLQNLLNFLSSEFHSTHGPLFGPADEETKQKQREKVVAKAAALFKANAPAPFLMGAEPNVADFYAYVITTWAGYVGVDCS